MHVADGIQDLECFPIQAVANIDQQMVDAAVPVGVLGQEKGVSMGRISAGAMTREYWRDRFGAMGFPSHAHKRAAKPFAHSYTVLHRRQRVAMEGEPRHARRIL